MVMIKKCTALYIVTLVVALSSMAYAQDASVQKRGLRVFHVGNSHTDQAYGMHEVARARGYAGAGYNRHMIPGAGLDWLWTYITPKTIKTIRTEKWDVMTLQTSTGGGTRVSSAVRFGGGYGKGTGYASLVYEASPDCQVYLFDSYPIRGQGGADRTPEQKWTQASKGRRGETIIAPRDATEAAADAISALYPQRKPCLIIPVGLVICELDKRMKQGKVPGYKSAYDFLEDKSHLNNDGKYVEAATFFAVIYREDPHGAITDGLKFWRGPYGVKKEFAEVVWDAVWDVVSTYRYTGVHPSGPVILGKSGVKTVPLGSDFSMYIPATGGSGKFKWAVTAGTLPAGLTLSPATGAIVGRPQVAGTSKVEITVSDLDPKKTEVAKGQYELVLAMPGEPAVQGEELEPAYVGVKYYAKVKTLGGYGTVMFSTDAGTLPPGLTLNAETGEITGTPTAVWTKPVKVNLRDEKGRASSKALKLSVAEKPVHGAVCGIYYQSFNSVADHTKHLRDEVVVSKNFTTEMVKDQASEPFALRFVSNIRVAKTGEYTFYIEACNGAVLDIDGKRVVDKDSFQKAAKPVAGKVTLKAGTHPIEVILYRRGLGRWQYTKWAFAWSGPGFEKQPIPDDVLMLEAN
jgi:PA14 domain-containing protein/putative Ig domain-containing protein